MTNPATSARLPNRATRTGGASLVTAALGFVAVFTYLAEAFDYPRVLDDTAAAVLPRLLELGTEGRAVWAVYALLPLLLIPAGIGMHAIVKPVAPSVSRAATVMSAIAALAMLVGLARWSTVHWALAQTFAVAGPADRHALGALFSGLNVVLGNFLGEFLGELALNAFFALSGHGLIRLGWTRLGWIGIAVSAIGLVAAFRNVTTVVDPVAEANNYVLPIWLVVQGGTMWMVGRGRPHVRRHPAPVRAATS